MGCAPVITGGSASSLADFSRGLGAGRGIAGSAGCVAEAGVTSAAPARQAAPAANPAGESADRAVPLPAPKPRQKSAMRQDAAPL